MREHASTAKAVKHAAVASAVLPESWFLCCLDPCLREFVLMKELCCDSDFIERVEACFEVSLMP